MATKVKVSIHPNRNWRNNAIQFPRLIAEMQVCGHFNAANMAEVAMEMDLEVEDVQALVSRACYEWDKIKEKTPA